MKALRVIGAACAAAAVVIAQAAAPSPYTGEQSRPIKALSADETAALLAGKGMGFAKAAELNGYPGPAHVLELASELQLSDAQKARTQTLFAAMEAKAIALGRALVEEERGLDRLFAEKAATPEALAAALARIGELQSKVRGAHLEAHLAQVRILTPEQTAKYAQLRGYGKAGGAEAEHAGHKH
jgi:Spy/CpxP family protein refolding chaperone